MSKVYIQTEDLYRKFRRWFRSFWDPDPPTFIKTSEVKAVLDSASLPGPDRYYVVMEDPPK